MEMLRSKTQAAVTAVKEKLPFVDGDGDGDPEPLVAPGVPLDPYVWSEKANRYRERKTGRFVKAETALGITAVAQVVRPPTYRSLPTVNRRKKKARASSEASPTSNTVYGPKPEEADLSALWRGTGDREELASKVMAADPILYLSYVAARDKFIVDEANARGAGIAESSQKESVLGRLQRRFRQYAGKDEQQPQVAPSEFSAVYAEALDAALESYGNLSPEERYERRQELEVDAGYALEWDVSQRKVEASQNKKFSLHRKAVVFGGMIIAGGVGAATSVWERLQKGEHDLRFLGAAALLGAGVGFGAAKAYQPAEDDTTVTAHAQEAREVVRRAYDKSSSDDVAHRAIGIESVREATKRDKRKALGRIALGIGGGAAAGVGGHLLVDVWPAITNYRLVALTDSPVQLEPSIDATPGVDVDSPIYHPLDTNHDGIVNGYDMPDSNQDGVIDYRDQAVTYDPLDTNRDGATDRYDMPDTNDDDVIDHKDHTPADTSPDVRQDDVVDDHASSETSQSEIEDADTTPPETKNETAPVEPAVTELPPQTIYIEPGSSITNEIHQYTYDTFGVDLSQDQLEHIYIDVIESGHYTPEQLFEGVDFYRMEDGRWGMQDVGSAELTGAGQTVIDDWLRTNHIGQ